MQTILFHETIFGPIHSRRLGVSLGVNLSPRDGKICNFDCIYCEAGYNAQGQGSAGLPKRAEVKRLLEERLSAMHTAGDPLDVITFSGNGEPTVNPDFPEIIADVIELRDKYYPNVKISVLTNSTMIGHQSVVDGLLRADNIILKLDSAIETTMRHLDRPVSASFTTQWLIEHLKPFKERAIIQTMITRGEHDGERVDNSTPQEIDALIEAYRAIKPSEIMLYTIDRQTPEHSLERVSKAELDTIAERITTETSIYVQVSA